jgi:hypothetical protein
VMYSRTPVRRYTKLGAVMESHPMRSRVGQFTWLLLQSASVVASILLAFAIDAWWGQRIENDRKNTMLRAIKEDLLDSRQWLETERAYRIAARASDHALLTAIAAGRYADTEKALDHRLADLLWFSVPAPPSGMLEGLLGGGGLASVDDETLRRGLVRFPNKVDQFSQVAYQDYQALTEVLTPFLSRNSSLPQISNAAYKHGRPGDGLGADPEAIVPTAQVIDHSALLRNQEFAGVVLRKLWIDSDVLYEVDDYASAMDELVRLIDLEIENTS